LVWKQDYPRKKSELFLSYNYYDEHNALLKACPILWECGCVGVVLVEILSVVEWSAGNSSVSWRWIKLTLLYVSRKSTSELLFIILSHTEVTEVIILFSQIEFLSVNETDLANNKCSFVNFIEHTGRKKTIGQYSVLRYCKDNTTIIHDQWLSSLQKT